MANNRLLFDELCSVVERAPQLFPDWLNRSLRLAKLFFWQGRAHEIPDEEIEGGLYGMLGEKFYLPFQTMAVEDTASIVLLEDETPNAFGTDVWRRFVECYPTDGSRFSELGPAVSPEARLLASRLPPSRDIVVVWGRIGEIRLVEQPRRDYALFNYHGGVVEANNETRTYTPVPVYDPDYHEFGIVSARNALQALREIALFNTPSRWVLEESLAKQGNRDPISSPKIPRAGDRPRFTLLTKEEIRTRCGLSGEDPTRSIQFKGRKRHTHFLKHPKYERSGLRFTHIPVRETWAGETESVAGKRRFKVRTDLKRDGR